MLGRNAERFLEDEGLTEGLTDEQAQELVGWLVEIARDLEEPAHLAQLQRLGREIARISRNFDVPIEQLIDLIELSWEDPDHPSEPPAMRA